MKDLKNKKLFLFDMDGTLYLGDRLYDFTNELLHVIKSSGKKYMFMTNNSSKSVEDYIKKLSKLGIKAEYDDFITSSQATGYYLNKYYKGKTLYVCGTNSLKAELIKNGYKITENLDEVEVVVMGFDTELTFQFHISQPTLTMFAQPSLALCPTVAAFAICYITFRADVQ